MRLKRRMDMELKFRVAARIAKPVHDVVEAVADPAKLSHYFTTGGAKGRLETGATRSEEHKSELQSLMRISYAGFCLKKKNNVSRLLIAKKKNVEHKKQQKT